ncbi:hypothetical protein HMPREF3226_02073 [Prevotella corporis]|uniref:Uncharacterized protein n=1 Tax=Prevotella corporis TaxID=28128 RepID=A0A133PYQ2_9BACT|nr:hypothetical protein HMPREF3226_02073 [Prevotella corporis]
MADNQYFVPLQPICMLPFEQYDLFSRYVTNKKAMIYKSPLFVS